MTDRRFLSILNAALESTGLDPARPASPADPGAVADWAAFLSACVARGVEVGDARWARVIVRRAGSAARFALPEDESPATEGEDPQDFQLGLSLLMSLLGNDPAGES